MDILAGLNPAQKDAVQSISGPVLIIAGPGSGKTRVIAHRIAYLIKVCGVNPHRVMAVTFTNKAAREMKERLSQLLGNSVNDLTLGTFHAICAQILRRDGQAIGVMPGFIIYDEEDQITLIKRSIHEVGLDPKQFAPKALLSAIDAAKSAMLTPQDYLQRGRSYFEEVVQRVYERYQRLLGENNALDFDDLLMKAVQLFRQSPAALSKYQLRYLHVHVDEFQDTNLTQYELTRLLAGKYRNICAVGDPDQSIYSWRNADLRNILNFEKDFPETKVILLEQNYRSTKMILDLASAVISVNPQRKPKKLWTQNEAGAPASLIEAYTEQEEAQFAINQIDRLVKDESRRLSDFAIMYRTNAQSRVLEESFVRYGMPYKLVAGTRFYERREVKDIIAYMRLVYNPYDSIGLHRIINIPQRGIGQRSLAELNRWAESRGMPEYEVLRQIAKVEPDVKHPFSPRTVAAFNAFTQVIEGFLKQSHEVDLVELFDLVVEGSGYKNYLATLTDGDDRQENILELRTVAQQYSGLPPGEGLAAFLEGVTLVSDVDGLDEKVEAVTLITLHQAKGLEFPVVFIVGMEDGILPHYKSLDDPQQMEEERRLCYVGITRAKQKVYLVRAFRRSLMGSSMVNRPSRFLQDMPPELVANGNIWSGESTLTKPAYTSSPPPAVSDLSELTVGDHVRHAQFGEGVVVNSRPAKDDVELTVAFTGGGVKKLLLSFARLEKV